MPLEKLMERYGGAPPKPGELRVWRKKENIQSPAIRPKQHGLSFPDSSQGDEEGANQEQGEGDPFDGEIKTSLASKLVNGHKEGEVDGNKEEECQSQKEVTTQSQSIDSHTTDSLEQGVTPGEAQADKAQCIVKEKTDSKQDSATDTYADLAKPEPASKTGSGGVVAEGGDGGEAEVSSTTFSKQGDATQECSTNNVQQVEPALSSTTAEGSSPAPEAGSSSSSSTQPDTQAGGSSSAQGSSLQAQVSADLPVSC